MNIKANYFYEIKDFVNSKDDEYLLIFEHGNTSEYDAISKRMVCPSIDDVCETVEKELQDWGYKDAIFRESGPESDKYFITFNGNGDHYNDNFTRIIVSGLKNEEEVNRIKLVCAKVLRDK